MFARSLGMLAALWTTACSPVIMKTPVAGTPTAIGVRDSKDPSGPVLVFTRSEWQAFVAGVKTGEFDL